MPELKDWHAHLAKQETAQREAKQRERLTILPVLREVSTKAQQVMDHPAWQWYATQLESRIADIEGNSKAKINTMIYGAAMGHELELIKIELNTMDAEVAGLRYAASLIADAVKMGQQIAGEVSQAAAGSADR